MNMTDEELYNFCQDYALVVTSDNPPGVRVNRHKDYTIEFVDKCGNTELRTHKTQNLVQHTKALRTWGYDFVCYILLYAFLLKKYNNALETDIRTQMFFQKYHTFRDKGQFMKDFRGLMERCRPKSNL